MKLRTLVVACLVLLAVGVGLLVGVPLIAQAPAGTPSTVANRTYDLWVSQGFASPPFFHFAIVRRSPRHRCV